MQAPICVRCATRQDARNAASFCPAGLSRGTVYHVWTSFEAPKKPESSPGDPISPAHYSRFKIQPIEFIMANAIGFCAGNVIKYVCRHDAKNGVEDLKKARSYLDKMIAQATSK